MSSDSIIEAFINPLVCFDAVESPADRTERKFSAESVLEYLADGMRKVPLEEMKRNYNQVGKQVYRLWMVPANNKILPKLVFPLKHALGYYMIGNSLESIAISGFVAEMATILKLKIYGVSVISRPVTTKEDEEENMRRIEKMKQSQRTGKLLELGLIDESLKVKFDYVSNKRNEYLHRFSMDEEEVAAVALKCFSKTLEIILAITGLTIQNGKAILDQKLLDYVSKMDSTQR